MNQKMREYLERQFEEVNKVTAEMFLTLTPGTGYAKDVMHIRQYLNYIEHAVMESQNCDNCQEVGLVDAPGPSSPNDLYPSQSHTSDASHFRGVSEEQTLREPDMMGGPLITEKIQIIQCLTAVDDKPRFQVWIEGMSVPYYEGSHNQCMIVHGYMTLYPTMNLIQMNDDSGGYLSESK